MAVSVAFAGFKAELFEFLRQLAAHNQRDWFQAHYADYQACLMEPARQFVEAMGDCVERLGPDVHADPKVRGSIGAITRDMRFAREKTPYKAHLDLWFWQGSGPSRERPGYYMRLMPERLMLGAGMHMFSNGALGAYRQAVLDDERGARLEQLSQELTAQGYELGGRSFKRVPAGLPADHPRATWLRHSGLFAGLEQAHPPELTSDGCVQFTFEHFQRLKPLMRWLVDVLPV